MLCWLTKPPVVVFVCRVRLVYFYAALQMFGMCGRDGGGELTFLVTVLISTSLSSDIDCVGQDEGPHHHHC